MENSAELWLVRHGQTDWNLEGRYQGQADIPLNQTGIDQARQLSLSLPVLPFTALYSSDLKRARMTADILSIKFDLPVQIDQRLREINQGEWEGHLVSDIKNRYQNQTVPGQKAIFMRPPGGEAVAEVAARMIAAANAIVEKHQGEKVLVVSHGLSVATLLCHVKGIPLDVVYSQIPENAQPTHITWTHNGSLQAA
jgi:broad specificity phosphatase PhoE